jgi:hypothetical protein
LAPFNVVFDPIVNLRAEGRCLFEKLRVEVAHFGEVELREFARCEDANPVLVHQPRTQYFIGVDLSLMPMALSRELFLEGIFVVAPSRTLDRSRRGNSFRLRVRNAATRRYLLPSPRVIALQVCDDTSMRNQR